MSPSVPEYIRSLAPYVPGKPIEETQRELGIRRVIKLASNENPLGPSPKAIQAARRVMKDLHRYPDSSAHRLRRVLAKNLNVDTADLLIGNGSNEVIDLLIRSYCVPGDAIVTSRAAFVAYKVCAQSHGVRTLEADLDPELRFDLPALLKLVKSDPRAKIVFIPNPNNPTGSYVTDVELREFLKETASLGAGREDVLVVLDYAYWEYVTAKDLPDPMVLQAEFPNVVVLRTFSKIYGLAGLRIGYGVARPEILAPMEKIRQPFNVNSMSLAAAEAAILDRPFVRRAKALNTAGMKLWERELREMRIPFWKSQGNFILADVGTRFGRSGAEVFQSCLKRGVIFRPVANYGLPNALRISIGTDAENRAAIRALKAELKAAGGSARVVANGFGGHA